MTIPERALRAAQEATEGGFGITDDYMRRALTAALPFLTGVKVKELRELAEEFINEGSRDYPEEVCRSLKAMGQRILSAIEGVDTIDTLSEPSPRAQALEEENAALRKAWQDIADLRLNEDIFELLDGLLDAADRALSSQPVADGWLPIETAPKDGTWFHAYRPETDLGTWDRLCIVCWSEEENDFVWPDEAFDIYRDDLSDTDDRGFLKVGVYSSCGSFTYWRPIAASPETSV